MAKLTKKDFFSDGFLNRPLLGRDQFGVPSDPLEQVRNAARLDARSSLGEFNAKSRKELKTKWNAEEKIDKHITKRMFGEQEKKKELSPIDKLIEDALKPQQQPVNNLTPSFQGDNLTRTQQLFRGTANVLDGVTMSRFFGGDGLSRVLNDRLGNDWTNKALSDDVNGQMKAADFTTDLLSPTLPMGGAYKAVDKGMDLTRALLNPKASQLGLNAQYGKGGELSKQAWSETAGIGGMAGLAYNVGENAMSGMGPGGDQRTINERLFNTTLEAGVGAGGDVAIRGIGKLFSPKLKQLTDSYNKGEINQQQFDEVINADQQLKQEILLLSEGQQSLPEPIIPTVDKMKFDFDKSVDVPEGLRLPEPKSQTVIPARKSDYSTKLDTLMSEARKQNLTPGREREVLESVWSQMAGPNDPDLDELIRLGTPSLKSLELQNTKPLDLLKKAKETQSKSVYGLDTTFNKLPKTKQFETTNNLGDPLQFKREAYNIPTTETLPPQSFTGQTNQLTKTKVEYTPPKVDDNLLNSLEYGDKVKVRSGRGEVELSFVKREGDQVVVKRNSGKETVVPASMVNGKVNNPLVKPNDISKKEVASALEKPMSKLSNSQESSKSIGKLYENISPQKEVPLQKVDKRLIPTDPNPKIDNPAELVKKQIDVSGKREKSKWSFDKIYTGVIDDLRPLDKATRELGGKGLDSAKNPYMKARLSRGVAGRAETYLKGGVYKDGKKVAPALEEIIKPIEKDMDNFLAYITSKRALDYDEKGLVAGIKPKGVENITDRQLAAATIKQLDNPEFQKAHQSIVDYSKRLLDELVESGVLTKESVDTIIKENPNYIPMFRVQDPKVRGFEPLPKQRFANLGEAIKKRTGSEKAITNPLESIIKNTYLMVNMAERNKVGSSLYSLVENAGENAWGRIVSKKKGAMTLDDLTKTLDEANAQLNDGKADAIDNIFKGEGNKINVFHNGEKVEMELQEDLYKSMLSLDTQKQNFFIKMLAVPTRTLRTGAVLSPDFGPVNIFRDQFAAYVNSKYGFKPFVDMARGMSSVIKKDEVYWNWMNNGGANSVLSTLDREYLQQDIRRMVKQSMKERVKTAVKQPIRTVLEPLRKVSEMTEEATRIGEFKKGLKKGATPQEAAFASRDLIDFSRAGTHGRQFNQITAFFNAATQSIDKLARTFKDDPKGASIRAMTGITLPSIAAYMYNHDQEWYKDLPQREKDLFWHFKQGDTIYKAPKPFEIGVLFGTVPERFAEYMKTNDPKAFKDLEDAVKDTFVPPWIPTAISPWIEVYANKSMYFDSPIVPRREEGLLPEDQFGPYTSELSKFAGDKLQKSPRKIDHVIKGYTGGLGRYALQMGDFGAEKLGGKERPELPDKGVGGMPIVNRFVVQNLEGSNQPINDFYSTMDTLRRERLSAKKNEKEYEKEETYKLFNKLSSEISELQAAKREIIAHKEMNGKEKTERIKKLDTMITKLAKVGLQNEGR